MNLFGSRIQAACATQTFRLHCVLLSCLFAGCGTPPPDYEAIPHKTWWNFYQRGLEHLENGRFHRAVEDFERSLGLRAGARYPNPTDAWRVRTYGMHIQQGYFPHRERGIAMLHLGLLEDARQSLERSLSQEPSGRAKHYLNAVRAKLLEGASLPPPSITPNHPVPFFSNSPQVLFSGVARADAFVANLLIDGIPQPIELAQKEVPFSLVRTLPPGNHTVVIEGSDLAGHTTRLELPVIIDPVAPTLAFGAPVRVGASWRFQVRAEDAHGLRSILVNRHPALPPHVSPLTSHSWEIFLPDGENIQIDIEDTAGNRIQRDVRGELIASLRATADGKQWAAAEPSAPDPSPLAPAPSPFPTLGFAGTRTRLTVNEPRYFVDGHARSTAGITHVACAGLPPWNAPQEAHLASAHFAFFVPLQLGTNRFEVIARDREGRASRENFDIEYVLPRHTRPEMRLACALPPFVGWTPTTTPAQRHKNFLEEALTSSQRRESPRFQLLSRGVDFLEVLQELRVNITDLVDERARLPLHRLVPCDFFFNGEVLSHPDGVSIRVHIFSAAEGAWVGAEDIFLPENESESLRFDGLASKLERRFPSLESVVARVVRGEVTLPAGREHGISAGARFLVARKNETALPPRLELIELEQGPLQIEAHKIGDTTSLCKIIPKEGNKLIRSGDVLIAR